MNNNLHLNILIVDDEPNIRKMLSVYCKDRGHFVAVAANIKDALREITQNAFDLAFLDIRLGVDNGLDLIPKLLSQNPQLKIIVITAFSSIETAVEAIRRGAAEYLPKPFTPDQLDIATNKIARLRLLEKKVESLQNELKETHPEVDLSTQDPIMERCLQIARQVAESDVSILIRGESGTGKTVLARAIHSWSKRKDYLFTVVSCPSLSPELLQSELFGHVKGAFTDAIKDNPGRIAATEGGTLFLDEIGDLPLNLQPKLLRFIQDRKYERLGDPISYSANVRLIAATNSNLEIMVKEGRFREDLFYRLNVVQIELPPLRERPLDLHDLTERLLIFFSKQYQRRLMGLTDEAKQALARHHWPGNTRELRNVIERAVILCKGSEIEMEQLPFSIAPKILAPSIGELVTLEKIEEEHLRRVLASTTSLDEAAKILGIDASTLWRKRKQYNL